MLQTIETLHKLRSAKSMGGGPAPSVIIELPVCKSVDLDLWKQEFSLADSKESYLRLSRSKQPEKNLDPFEGSI